VPISNLGWILYLVGDYDAARPIFRDALEIFRLAGAKSLAAYQLKNLGCIAQLQGDNPQATACFEESLTLYRETGSKSDIAKALSDLGIALGYQGDRARVTALLTEALAVSQAIGESVVATMCLLGMANIQQNPIHAASLLAAVQAALEGAGQTIGTAGPFYRVAYEHIVQTTQSTLGEVVFAAAWTEGRQMTLDQAIAYAKQSSVMQPESATHPIQDQLV